MSDSPRLEPLSPERWSAEQANLMEPFSARGRALGVLSTLIRHPDIFEAFTTWGGFITKGTSIAPRDREIAILRTAFLCKAPYEWAQHVVIAQLAGVQADEIPCLKGPLHAIPGRNGVLARAAEELHVEQRLTDATWHDLGAFLDERQRVELLLAVGNYTGIAMLLNTLGVQLEAKLLEDDLCRL